MIQFSRSTLATVVALASTTTELNLSEKLPPREEHVSKVAYPTYDLATLKRILDSGKDGRSSLVAELNSSLASRVNLFKKLIGNNTDGINNIRRLEWLAGDSQEVKNDLAELYRRGKFLTAFLEELPNNTKNNNFLIYAGNQLSLLQTLGIEVKISSEVLQEILDTLRINYQVRNNGDPTLDNPNNAIFAIVNLAEKSGKTLEFKSLDQIRVEQLLDLVD